MELIQLNEDEFASFCNTFTDINFWQSVSMAKDQEAKGRKILYVGVKEKDHIVAAAFLYGLPTFRNLYIYHMPRGPLLDYENSELLSFFIKSLKRFMKKQQGLYVRMDPYIIYLERDIHGNAIKNGINHQHIYQAFMNEKCKHRGFKAGFESDGEPRWMMVLPLKNQDEKSVLKGMDQLRRRSIKKSEKNAIHLEILNIDQMDIFENIMKSTGERLGIDSRDVSYFRNMQAAFKDQMQVVIAKMNVKELQENAQKILLEKNTEKEMILQKMADVEDKAKLMNKLTQVEEIIHSNEKKAQEAATLFETHGEEIILGGGMFMVNKREIVYLLGGAYQEYMKYSGFDAIQWHMINEALAQGCSRYNFYGISGDFSEDGEDYGVYTFKKGFGAEVRELMGTFILPVHSFWYHVYTIIKKIRR